MRSRTLYHCNVIALNIKHHIMVHRIIMLVSSYRCHDGIFDSDAFRILEECSLSYMA